MAEELTQKLILTELESPIHDGINVELVYDQLLEIDTNIATSKQVENAVLIAARKYSKSAISR